jgi:hypothetical protein
LQENQKGMFENNFYAIILSEATKNAGDDLSMTVTCVCFWYARQDSNLRPTDLKSAGFCNIGVSIDFGMEW